MTPAPHPVDGIGQAQIHCVQVHLDGIPVTLSFHGDLSPVEAVAAFLRDLADAVGLLNVGVLYGIADQLDPIGIDPIDIDPARRDATRLGAHGMVSAFAAVRDVFARAGSILDDEGAVDAELLDIANKAGGSLVAYHRGETEHIPYAALAHLVTCAAALRAILGLTSTPTPRELVTTLRAATSPRPGVCPDCQEIGLCAVSCRTATEHGWPREVQR